MWESFTSTTTITIGMVTASIHSKITTTWNDTTHLLEYWGLLASNLILFLLMTIMFLGFKKMIIKLINHMMSHQGTVPDNMVITTTIKTPTPSNCFVPTHNDETSGRVVGKQVVYNLL